MTKTNKRTTQDLLAERRANVQEARRERDEMACMTLLAHVAVIDAELERRRLDDAADRENAHNIAMGGLRHDPMPVDREN